MRIDFEFITRYGTFKDCLILPDDAEYTEEELTAMKNQRLENWINVIASLSDPVEPSVPPSDPVEG